MKWMLITTLTTKKNSNNSTAKKIAVIITAAGSSVRMGGKKKEFLPLNSGTVLSNCAVAFLKAFSSEQNSLGKLTNLVITIPAGTEEQTKQALFCDKNYLLPKDCTLNFVTGSSTRQKSIFNALQFLNDYSTPNYVLIHDGARPFITPEDILTTTSAAIEFGAAAPGFTPTDTIKQIDENGFIKTHLVRKELICIQTPQAFEFSRLYTAHATAAKEPTEYTDDTEIWGKFVGKVKITQGNPQNKKITYPQDLVSTQNQPSLQNVDNTTTTQNLIQAAHSLRQNNISALNTQALTGAPS